MRGLSIDCGDGFDWPLPPKIIPLQQRPIFQN